MGASSVQSWSVLAKGGSCPGNPSQKPLGAASCTHIHQNSRYVIFAASFKISCITKQR